MAVDNTHTKYLKGADKVAWNNFKEAYEAQKKLELFFSRIRPKHRLKEGEEYEVPINKNLKTKK